MSDTSPVDQEFNKLTKNACILLGGAITASFLASTLSIVNTPAEKDNKTLFKELNMTATSAFTSVAGCIADGLTEDHCNISRHNANRRAEKHPLAYSSLKACIETHKEESCKATSSMSTTGVATLHLIGGSLLVTPVASPNNSYYTVLPGAWQTANQDPSLSAPLYPTRTEGQFIRQDGRTFDLN